MRIQNIMRIRQPLPEEFAEKWRRLLAFQGGDPEALALAAVELLWKKYHREVEREERAEARMEANLKKTKERLRGKCSGNRSKGVGALVGSCRVKMSEEGVLKLPASWYEQLGRPTEVYVMPLPREESVALFSIAEKKSARKATKISVAQDRTVRLDKKIIRHAHLKGQVILKGCIRYARIEPGVACTGRCGESLWG